MTNSHMIQPADKPKTVPTETINKDSQTTCNKTTDRAIPSARSNPNSLIRSITDAINVLINPKIKPTKKKIRKIKILSSAISAMRAFSGSNVCQSATYKPGKFSWSRSWRITFLVSSSNKIDNSVTTPARFSESELLTKKS